MAKNSKIEWTHHTFNAWTGCTKVSIGCDHCYAESWAKRSGLVEWGSGKPRKLTTDANWRQPLKWNREAKEEGVRCRVFCSSLADVFDNEIDPSWRKRLFDLVRQTPSLDWIIVTKRIGNAMTMLPADWGAAGYPNVWLLATVCNQAEADRDVPKLLRTPAAVHGLSIEPMLEPIDLSKIPWSESDGYAVTGNFWRYACDNCHGFKGGLYDFVPPPEYQGDDCDKVCPVCKSDKLIIERDKSTPGIDWVIVGGESGAHSRPMDDEWVIKLLYQCREYKVPFFFKQWGGVNKAESGRLLFGKEWNEYPINGMAKG